MPARTSMLHVRVDDRLETKAADALAGVGLTLSDAARILLNRVAAEGGLPAGPTTNPEAHDAWFRARCGKPSTIRIPLLRTNRS